MICVKCISLVENMHCFRKICLEKSLIYLSYINQLSSDSKVRGKVSVYLEDCFVNDKNIEKEKDDINNKFDEDEPIVFSKIVLSEMKTEYSEGNLSIYGF